MTNDQIKEAIKVMQAFLDGKTIEYRGVNDEWKDLTHPSFNFSSADYRIKEDNLFDGAPIMVRIGNDPLQLRYYAEENYCYDYGSTNYTDFGIIKMRLPTFEESPKNTWLAAPADGKCPDDLPSNVLIMTWNKYCLTPNQIIDTSGRFDWKRIWKYMIFQVQV